MCRLHHDNPNDVSLVYLPNLFFAEEMVDVKVILLGFDSPHLKAWGLGNNRVGAARDWPRARRWFRRQHFVNCRGMVSAEGIEPSTY